MKHFYPLASVNNFHFYYYFVKPGNKAVTVDIMTDFLPRLVPRTQRLAVGDVSLS
jgi:hypothetical protein